MSKEIIIHIENLSKHFANYGIGIKGKSKIYALNNINLDIYSSETLALVGESGCGKTTLGRTILGILQPTEGDVKYRGRSIFTGSNKTKKEIKRNMQMVFQDPYSSLNPKMSVRRLIEEPLLSYGLFKNSKERLNRVIELLRSVGLSEEHINRYPSQFSGGQRQRIGIARAIALSPEFVVCDEPVSALDVSVQAQILNLLRELQVSKDLSYLFISHDLGVVRYIADRVCIMFLGMLCEIGDVELIYENPKHPYTKYLIDSVPKMNIELRNIPKKLLTGEVLSSMIKPQGCRFYGRCQYKQDICQERFPEGKLIEGRLVYCNFPL
ncbi:ABC transporter ATP-binding protein [Tissierella praeacuta]|uniref:ABC transporter ATP-binding protein n=1 Tax=Tissierella praeacuta TaxID=43131 RepID=UPI003DA6A310